MECSLCRNGRTKTCFSQNEQVALHSTHRRSLLNWIHAVLKEGLPCCPGSSRCFILSSVTWHFYASTFLRVVLQINSARQIGLFSAQLKHLTCAEEGRTPCPLPASGSIRQHLWRRSAATAAPRPLCQVGLQPGHPCASPHLHTGSDCRACLGTHRFCGILSPGESQWTFLFPCPTCHINMWAAIDHAQKSCK